MKYRVFPVRDNVEVATYDKEDDAVENLLQIIRDEQANGDYVSRSYRIEYVEGEKMKKMYMNIHTGNVDDYDGWYYETESGETVNAVDAGEVIEVIDYGHGGWIEAEEAV